MDFETEEERTRLRDWLRRYAPDKLGLRLVEASRMSAGHSNDTFSAVVEWDAPGGPAREAYVLRTRPEGVGLLEPYDVSKQYRIMQALAGTAVPVPRMLWFDEAGEVLGRPMFAMEKLDGVIIEAEIPDYLVGADPAKVRRMCERYIDAVATIHLVDWQAAGLAWLQPSADLIETEIGWWDQEIRRFQRGPLPAVDVIVDWLRANRPLSSPRVALVHGDAKPGNVLYDDETVRAMFDWEMTTLGDPLTDIGWLAWLWTGMGGLSSLPGALTKEEMLRRYEERTGISTAALPFYEVLAGFKMVAILFVGAMLFDSGKSNDLRYVGFGQNIPFLVARLLALIGESPSIPAGETSPRLERIIEGLQQTVSGVVLPELHSLVARTQARTIPLLVAGLAASLMAPSGPPAPLTTDEIEARALAPR